MAINTLPDDWAYEGPDESVGIFGETIYHNVATHDYVAADHLAGTSTYSGEGVTRYRHDADIYICPACKKTAMCASTYYDPDTEE